MTTTQITPNELPRAHTELIARVRDLAEFRGTAPMKALDQLLEALEAGYTADLVNVTPERLASTQRLVKQMRALRRIAAGDASNNGRV